MMYAVPSTAVAPLDCRDRSPFVALPRQRLLPLVFAPFVVLLETRPLTLFLYNA